MLMPLSAAVKTAADPAPFVPPLAVTRPPVILMFVPSPFPPPPIPAPEQIACVAVRAGGVDGAAGDGDIAAGGVVSAADTRPQSCR